MDLSELAQSVVTIVVAIGAAYKSAKGTADSAGKQVRESESNLDQKLNDVISNQKSEAVRLDKLTERVDSLSVSFKIHDKAQLEREQVMTRVLDTVQNISKAQLMVAKDQNEIAKSKKIWLDEQRVKVTEPKKSGGNKS